jgi:hypothetical protein
VTRGLLRDGDRLRIGAVELVVSRAVHADARG